MNIATAGMRLTSQINVQFSCQPLRSQTPQVSFSMVTHLINSAKNTNSVFTILTTYHYTLHTERLKTPFFTAAIQIYCDAITEQRHNQHTRCTVLIGRAQVLAILGLLIRFIKKTAGVQELTYRNKAYKHSKTLFFIINNKTMSCPVTLPIPTPAQITYTVPYKAYGM